MERAKSLDHRRGRLFITLLVATGLLAACFLVFGWSLAPQTASGTDTLQDLSDLTSYIKFEGLEGEVTARDHQGWSNVLAFNQSIDVPTTETGRATGGATFEEVIVVKELDRIGPHLQEAAATGARFPEVTIDVVHSATRTVVYHYVLEDVVVTSYNVGTTGQADLTPSGLPRVETAPLLGLSHVPVEEVGLSFRKITAAYVELTPEGKALPPVEFEWNLASRGR